MIHDSNRAIDPLAFISQPRMDLAIAYLDSESYPVDGKFIRRKVWIQPPNFWPYTEGEAW